jgi:serine/threonine protein kinase
VRAVLCRRHPRAAAHHGFCAACLLEGALDPEAAGSAEAVRRFTIHLPLGAREGASVFLVTAEWPWRRLLRLKTWRHPAPPDFPRRFVALQTALEQLDHDSVLMPIAAWQDAEGRPYVLTEFRQGVPLLDRVTAGKLTPAQACDALGLLLERTVAAHRHGLVHGSITPGNVLSAPDGTPFLLDFGLAPVVAPGDAAMASPRSDVAAFEHLQQVLSSL